MGSLETDLYHAPMHVVGASFRTLPVADRESLASLSGRTEEILDTLLHKYAVQEAAVLSTCNRFEVIVVDERSASDARRKINIDDDILNLLRGSSGRDIESEGFYRLQNREAVRHVLRVASSLDSMVVGETQILGQVKDCYERSVKAGSVGRFLHHLFQFSFRIAKKIRSETGISEHGVSISYVAVKLAEQIFGSLQGKSVLVIGSGRMAEIAALHLKSYGCGNLIIANRTLERACELANKMGGSAIALSDIAEHLSKVDVVIGSITAEAPVIDSRLIAAHDPNHSLFLIDLGVPRNFSPAIAEREGVYLYNIDDLSSIVDENKSLREAAAKEAEILLEYALFQFERWLLKISAEPAVVGFRAHVAAACESEINEMLKGRLEDAVIREIVPALSQRLSAKISHELTQMIADSPNGKLDYTTMLPFIIDDLLKA